MGEDTPDPVQIRCPHCARRFRLKPKKGRLPTADIPCPRCTETIPVKDGRVVTDDEQDDGPETSESAPGFGITAPGKGDEGDGDGTHTESPDDAESSDSRPASREDEAIAQLDEMAEQHPSSDSKSTMGGLPGIGRNQFNESRSESTKTVDREQLQKLANESSGATEDEEDSPSNKFSTKDPPKSSPRLMDPAQASELANESSTAATGFEDVPDDDSDPPRGLKGEADSGESNLRAPEDAESQIRETAENKTISREMVDNSGSDGDSGSGGDTGSDGDSAPSSSEDHDEGTRQLDAKKLKKKSLLDRVKKRSQHKRKTVSDDDGKPPSGLDRLKQKSSPSSSGDEGSEPEQKGDRKSSLSNLFEKVRKRRGVDSGELRDKLKESDIRNESDLKAALDDADTGLAEEVDISEGELTEIVNRSASAGGDTGQPATAAPEQPGGEDRQPADSSKPPPEETDHSGLFEDVESAAEDQPAASGEIETVSDSSGSTTTSSMLARLQKGRQGDADSSPGAAGEKRGSGYIRLPTEEIQDVLGQGDFRLKIEGIVYEPVDKEGLIKLIKGGVLLGAEQIAEGDDDWMPVSEHPVFGELRRKMAAEAHQVLSRMGSKSRPDDEPEPESADSPPAKAPGEPGPGTREDAPTPRKNVAPPHAEQPQQQATPQPEPGSGDTAEDSVPEIAPEQVSPIDEEPSEDAGLPETEQLDSVEVTPLDDESDGGAPAGEPPDSATSPSESADLTPETNEPPPERHPAPPDRDGIDEDDLFDEVIETAAPEQPVPDKPESEEEISETLTEPDELEQQQEEPVPVEVPGQQGSSIGKFVVAVVVLALIGGAGFLLLTAQGHDIVTETTGWAPEEAGFVALLGGQTPDAETPSDRPDPAVVEAVDAASSAVVEALPESPERNEVDEWVQQQLEAEQFDEAAAAMTPQFREGRRDRDFLLNLIEARHQTGDYQGARRAARAGIVEFPDDEAFLEAHSRTIEDDETLFAYDSVELDDPDAYRAAELYDVADHRGVVLEPNDAGEQKVLFKPMRDGFEFGWRAEVASWRLCQLMVCHFEVLEVQPGVATRGFLENLEGEVEGLDALIADANWETIEVGGESVEAVQGSLEQFPEQSPAPFPIEYRPLWRDWLTAGRSTEFADEPASSQIDRLEGLADGRFYEALQGPLESMSTEQLARSVSSLLVFDYLTNNWERFSTRTEEYGRNNPVIRSSVVSRHNGGAFQPRASNRVRGRFEWTSRFSRSTVASIRALDRETTFQVLFPDATSSEQHRLEVMWSQRSNMLERIDSLVSRHEEQDVLLFP